MQAELNDIQIKYQYQSIGNVLQSNEQMQLSIIAYLHRFHVQYFCDAALHNQEIRIVHIHLNGAKQIGHSFIQHSTAIDEIFIFTAAADTDLPRNCDFFAIFKAHWAIIRIGVVKNYSYRCFCNTALTIFENQLLQ